MIAANESAAGDVVSIIPTTIIATIYKYKVYNSSSSINSGLPWANTLIPNSVKELLGPFSTLMY
jgi:hypothetical protein